MIVVGVDGSPHTLAALEWAVSAANDRKTALKIVHVSDGSTGAAADALQTLSEAEISAHAVGLTMPVTMHLASGDPGPVLVAESKFADLVVVASHGHSRMHDAFVSSVSLHTAMHARCPVVVTRPHLPPQPGGNQDAVGRILVGVDGSPLSLAAVDFAFEEAARQGVGVTALHTWVQPVASGHDVLVPIATDLEALQAENEALLAEVLAGAHDRYPDVDVSQLTLQGTAGTALIEASMGARLLVVGSRGRGPVAGLLLGSVSHAVLHHAGCTVAVIPAPPS